MTYVDGFVLAVPAENKGSFASMQGGGDLFRVRRNAPGRNWADDVPKARSRLSRCGECQGGRDRRLLLDGISVEGSTATPPRRRCFPIREWRNSATCRSTASA